MNYHTKGRVRSSQRKQGKWTSKQCPRVMLLELYKVCTIPRDKHHQVKGKAALFLFTISLQWFSRPPHLGSCKTETWAGQWGDRVRTGMMPNPSNLCITSPDFPANELLVGWHGFGIKKKMGGGGDQSLTVFLYGLLSSTEICQESSI